MRKNIKVRHDNGLSYAAMSDVLSRAAAMLGEVDGTETPRTRQLAAEYIGGMTRRLAVFRAESPEYPITTLGLLQLGERHGMLERYGDPGLQNFCDDGEAAVAGMSVGNRLVMQAVAERQEAAALSR